MTGSSREAGEFTPPQVLAGGFTTHTGGICRLIKVLMSVLHCEQSPYLLVGNHLKSPDLRNFKQSMVAN